MRNIFMMAALGAAVLYTASCGGNTTPPVDCDATGAISAGCSELRLTSTPGGAAIAIDGITLGLTPAVWLGPRTLLGNAKVVVNSTYAPDAATKLRAADKLRGANPFEDFLRGMR